MKQEEKELLLQDLCGRLPHSVVCECSYNKENGSSDRLKICSEGTLQLNTDVLGLFIEDEINLLPYLRPMSSMTEEEWKEFDWFVKQELDELIRFKNTLKFYVRHHIDYNGLIPMGLALPAPEGMYND